MPPEFFRLLFCFRGKKPYIHFPVMHVPGNQHVVFMSPFLRAQALQEMYECIMWFTTKTDFHEKLITPQKHTGGRVYESTDQCSNTFSVRIQVLDFLGHLTDIKSSFKVLTFPFSKGTMSCNFISNKKTFRIMSSCWVSSRYHSHDNL